MCFPPWLSVLLNRCFLGTSVPFIPPGSCSTHMQPQNEDLLSTEDDSCLQFVSLTKIHFHFEFGIFILYSYFPFYLPHWDLGFWGYGFMLSIHFHILLLLFFKKILLICILSNGKNIINSVYTIKISINHKWYLILNDCSRWWTVSICVALQSQLPSNHKLHLLSRISGKAKSQVASTHIRLKRPQVLVRVQTEEARTEWFPKLSESKICN